TLHPFLKERFAACLSPLGLLRGNVSEKPLESTAKTRPRLNTGSSLVGAQGAKRLRTPVAHTRPSAEDGLHGLIVQQRGNDGGPQRASTLQTELALKRRRP